MEFTLSTFGMILIIVSWIIQIGATFKGCKSMRPCFAGLQALGIILLVVDSYRAAGGMGAMSYLNVVSAAGALIMLVLLMRK